MQGLEHWPTEKLIDYARNPRKNDHAVDRVSAAIKEFGFRVPIIAKSDGLVVDGHLRLKAAKKLGLVTVPVLLADDLSPAQIKAFRLSVNKMAELAEWDDEMLAVELSDLKDMGFDLDLTGFSTDEIEALLTPTGTEGLTDEDAVPEVPEAPVTVLGDVWLLGKHRVMCGDSTSIDAVERLMGGAAVDMVFTDPPYGISIVSGGGKVGGRGAFGGKKNEKKDKSNVIQSSNFAPVAGDNSINVAVETIQVIQTLGAKVEIIWGGNYYAASLPNSSCWLVWDKQNTGNFADCELAWTNQKTAVRKFEHMWNGMVKASEHGQKRVHPTQKPVALAAWCLEQYGGECESVLDLFGGSGFTLIACEQKNKTGYIMELSASYVDIIVQRWMAFTGQTATLESTGNPFISLKKAA